MAYKEVPLNPIIYFPEEREISFTAKPLPHYPEPPKHHQYRLESFRFTLSTGEKLVRWGYKHEALSQRDWELACLDAFRGLAEL